MSVTQVIDGINGTELADLGKAIEAHDLGKFTGTFDRLTAACNACHQVTKHQFIVIRRPAALPYSNQSFAPSRRGRSPSRDGPSPLMQVRSPSGYSAGRRSPGRPH